MAQGRTSRKKVMASQRLIGQRGIAYVEKQILDMGYTWNPTNGNLDVGIDGFIEIINKTDSSATGCMLAAQVKATTKPIPGGTDNQIAWTCTKADVDYWLGCSLPVILFVVDLTNNEAFWADIRAAFSDPVRRRTSSVVINKMTHQLNDRAGDLLASIAVPKDRGYYLPAIPQSEDLFTNLVRLTGHPDTIFIASTDHHDPMTIIQWAKDHDTYLQGGWYLFEGKILSFHNLREPPWDELCDRGTVERFDTSDWAASQDAEQQKQFVRLLNEALRSDLRRKGIWWSKENRCFYFPMYPARDGSPQPFTYKYRSLINQTSSDVVSLNINNETKELYSIRHHALEAYFRGFSGDWYLLLSPTYLFTKDGRIPHPRGDEFTSGKKRLERQQAVLGQVIMWRHKLVFQKPKGLFDGDDLRQPLLTFGEIERVTSKSTLIDSEWLPSEHESPAENSEIDDTDEWGLT